MAIIDYFPATIAADENAQIVKGASAQVYALADTTFSTPLAITDLQGVPMPELRSSEQGIYPAFRVVAGTLQIVVVSGGLKTPMTSLSVYANAAEQSAIMAGSSAGSANDAAGAATLARQQAQDALTATNLARAAAEDAATRAEAVPLTNDGINESLILTPGTKTETALKATFADAVAEGVAVPTAALVGMTAEVLNRSCRYLLTTWLPSIYPGTGQITFSGVEEINVRPFTAAAVGLAVAISTDKFDPDIAGVSKAAATSQAVRLISSAAAQHKATAGSGGWGGTTSSTPPPATNTGPDWQAGMWAMYTAAAAHLLWGSLSGAQRTQVTSMLVYEANRLLTWSVPFWKSPGGTENYAGDSKSEEISWSAALLTVALVMQPSHANADAWEEKLVQASAACFAVPADLTDTKPINGLTPSAWLTGTNANPDGSIVNHGIVHPDYMSSVAGLMGLAMSVADRTGVSLPAIVERHISLVYSSLSKTTYLPPDFQLPGGSIYPWPPIEGFYYPQGNDWGTARTMDKAGFDVAAHAYGWDRGLTYPAARAAFLHLRKQLALQKRNSDGRTYSSAEEDTYGGREQWVASLAGSALLALVAAPTRVRSYANVYLPRWAKWSDAMTYLAPAMWWRLADTSGATIADASGNSRPGTVVGGSGLTFGASSLIPSEPGNNAVDIGTPGVLIARAHESWMDDTSFTFMFSIRKSAAPGATQIIAGLTSTGVTSSRMWHVGIRPTSGYIFASTFNGGSATDINTVANVCDGNTHLVVVVVDGTTARVYVDGALVGSAAGLTVNSSPTARFCLGARSDDSAPTTPSIPLTDARIDDVAYFTTAYGADVVANVREAWGNTP